MELPTPTPGLRLTILMPSPERLLLRVSQNEDILWQRETVKVIQVGRNRFILSFTWAGGIGRAWLNGNVALAGDAHVESIEVGAGTPPDYSKIWSKDSQKYRSLRRERSIIRYNQVEKDPYLSKKSYTSLIQELKEYNNMLSDNLKNISIGKLYSWRSLAQTLRTLISDYGPKSSSQPFLFYIAGLWDTPLFVYCFGSEERESTPLLDDLSFGFSNDVISAFQSYLQPSKVDIQVWMNFGCVTLPKASGSGVQRAFKTYNHNQFLREIADQEAAHGASATFSVADVLKCLNFYNSEFQISQFLLWLRGLSEAVLHIGATVVAEAELRQSLKD